MGKYVALGSGGADGSPLHGRSGGQGTASLRHHKPLK